MTELVQFEAELRSVIGPSPAVRPFVCNGSPLECRAFIVGFNPATEMAANFWSFWLPGYGFDKAAWFEEYKAERLRKPLRPNQKHRSPVSNSRRVIEWVVQGAAPIPILETNLFALPTEKAADLDLSERKATSFDLLMKWIRPRVVVTHGNEAKIEVRRRAPSAIIIDERHFSRGWSQADARALGQRIKLACREAF